MLVLLLLFINLPFPPKVAPVDMLPVLDDDYSAIYIHRDVNKTHEFLFDTSHYRCMNIYQIKDHMKVAQVQFYKIGLLC